MYVFYLYVHVKKNNKIQFFQLNSAIFWFNVYALSDFQGSIYFVIRLVGRTLCSPRTKTSIKPMSKTNVGANLMFELRTKTGIKPMFENELETFASDIGSQAIVVRRANTRFAPTLVSDIGRVSITTIYPKIYDRLLIVFMGRIRLSWKQLRKVSDDIIIKNLSTYSPKEKPA